jgi:excisionase family DNA binding protein
MSKLLTISEVANVLRCHPKSVLRLIQRGRLRAVHRPITQSGRGKRPTHLVFETDLEAYINGLPEAPTAQGYRKEKRPRAHAVIQLV